MDKFDEYAATAPKRPPALPPIGLTNFYGSLLQSQMAPPTPPFRLPGETAGPAPPMERPVKVGQPLPSERQPMPQAGMLTNTAGGAAKPKNPRDGKIFIDRIEDNGVAVLLDGDGDNYKTLNMPAQKGWKEGQWLDRSQLPRTPRKRRPIP